ncbi:uncharacterized protein EURHEDRAFT_173761 [Aspergillus ruber CBS 135680]|uniref:Uncharacterized protein n=1 Tax=Aspergillus ruber (strain CBS 135680) TaxID=1388766 RepID=A0A017S9Z6_ASPRC|nr:uncharacterized protein EURHEDRAFT_173761 [Aspergillus ruber CBS 135680]EYE93005.1 hypothetical protein EURHEDRAFT_173761 [Aspergillus ruber CBS 135680]
MDGFIANIQPTTRALCSCINSRLVLTARAKKGIESPGFSKIDFYSIRWCFACGHLMASNMYHTEYPPSPHSLSVSQATALGQRQLLLHCSGTVGSAPQIIEPLFKLRWIDLVLESYQYRTSTPCTENGTALSYHYAKLRQLPAPQDKSSVHLEMGLGMLSAQPRI